jgi:hypothetical protein
MCCLIALVGALVMAQRAQGFDGIRLSGPPTMSLGSPQLLTYRATFTGGGFPQSFSAAVSAPGIPEGGSSMLLTAPPTVTGSGNATTEPVVQVSGGRACSSIPGQEHHSYLSSGTSFRVELGPSDAVTLEFIFRTGDFPIRPADGFAPSLGISSALIQDGDGAPPRGLGFPAPAPTGPQGVDIKLRTRPGGPAAVPDEGFGAASTALDHAGPARIAKGRPITILGSTHPRLARQKIRLIYTGPGRPGVVRTLAHVRTDKKGKFRLSDWTPRRLGSYEVSAIYRSRLSSRLSDFAGCSKLIELVAGGKR